MIVEEGHIALMDEMKFATRKYRAPYGLEQMEMKQGEKELNAAGPLYVALTEYKKQDPATPSPLSVGTPGDKRSGPVETRFRDVLERRRAESERESMDVTLSEAKEEMEVGNTPEQKDDFRPQKASSNKGSTNGQTWEVDVGKEWISSEHQAIGKQVASDPLEKNATRNTARPWWVAQ